MRAPPAPVVALVVSLALVGGYAAAGGTSFEPTPTADPCSAREQPVVTGTGEAVERVVLRAADVTACSLGVSRERLVLALRSVDRLERLADENGVDRDELERSLRQGLVTAADEAERQGLIGDSTAGGLRAVATRLPLTLLLAILRGGSSLLD